MLHFLHYFQAFRPKIQILCASVKSGRCDCMDEDAQTQELCVRSGDDISYHLSKACKRLCTRAGKQVLSIFIFSSCPIKAPCLLSGLLICTAGSLMRVLASAIQFPADGTPWDWFDCILSSSGQMDLEFPKQDAPEKMVQTREIFTESVKSHFSLFCHGLISKPIAHAELRSALCRRWEHVVGVITQACNRLLRMHISKVPVICENLSHS